MCHDQSENKTFGGGSAHRMGALRFKLNAEGFFLNDNEEMASPPWTSLPELEQASLKFEEDNTDDPEYLKWLNMLIAPGSSLGGARPKASVTDKQKRSLDCKVSK